MTTIARIKQIAETDEFEALALATEKQVSSIIDSGFWSDDYFSRHQDAQEEMRILLADAQLEFGA